MLKRLLIIAALILAGCGGAHKGTGAKHASRSRKGGLGRIDEGRRCESKDGRESLVDLNQDDIPDVRKVYKTVGKDEVLVCREADMNFDGVKDIFVFFDDQGQIIRDEVDLDYDHQIDIISTYAKGKVVKQEMDTNSDGLVDRVRHLKDNVPFRVEGDMNGDGRVDLWEYYEDGRLVRLGTDENGDGKADTWSRDAAVGEPADQSADKPNEEEDDIQEKAEVDEDDDNDKENAEKAVEAEKATIKKTEKKSAPKK